MVVINNSRTTCIDVIKYESIPQFLQDASEVLTGFITFAKGEKMIFPIPFLLNKIRIEFSNDIEKEHVKFVIKIREMEVFNAFEIKVATLELPGTFENVMDIDVPGFIQVLTTFNAIPADREKGRLRNGNENKSDKEKYSARQKEG